jgi:hypothetical protein
MPRKRRGYLAEGEAPDGYLDDLPSPLMQPGAVGYVPPVQEGPTIEGRPLGSIDIGDPEAGPQFDGEFDPMLTSTDGVKPGLRSPSAYDAQIDSLKALIGQRPVQTSPKWWQRVAAGAEGGLAGWSNAASRTKHPIDIQAATESILHPGYANKLQEWQSRVAPAQALLDLEGKRTAASNTERELQRKEALESAQAGYYKAHGDYMEGLGRQPNQWKIDPKTGSLYNAQTGERHEPPPTPQDRFKAAKALGADDGTAQYYALNSSLAGYGSTLQSDRTAKTPNAAEALLNRFPVGSPAYIAEANRQFALEHRAPREPLDPDRQRPMSPRQKTAIETKHQDAYRKLSSDILTKKPTVDAAELANYEKQQKQLIEDAYAAELSAATGDYIPAYDFNQQQPVRPQGTQQPSPQKTKVWNPKLNRFE